MLKKAVLNTLLQEWTQGGFSVIFWDGEKKDYGNEKPSFSLVFNKEPQIDLKTTDIILTLGEAYMDGVIDIDGPMDAVLRCITRNTAKPLAHEDAGNLKKEETTTTQIEQQNIHHHYDVGNDFFALWLDDTMSYSCGYFKTPQDSLNQAQLQKIDHILKKLALKPGEKLLDIGSGWGGLMLRAVRQYHVKATGITLSTEQYNYTKEQIQKYGLDNLADVKLISYQDLDATQSRFDKIVSVGMFEHVGKNNLSHYIDKVTTLLPDGGMFLLHTITGMFESTKNAWMGKYIFPGGYVPSLRETTWIAPEYDLHLLHAESLRLHYALTLDHWYENFARNITEIRKTHDERFVRMWSLYLRGCAAAFRVSGLDIYQLLFTKGLNNNIPLTYDRVYNN